MRNRRPSRTILLLTVAALLPVSISPASASSGKRQSGVDFLAGSQNRRTILLSGGSARELFDRYLDAAEAKNVPVDYDHLTVAFVENGRNIRLRAGQDVKLSLGDLLRGKSMADKWRFILKDRRADEIAHPRSAVSQERTDWSWEQSVPVTLAEEINSRNQGIQAQQPGASRKHLAEQTAEAYETRVGSDPFALYALAKTVIYSGEHHEAFEMLEKAARLAIQQGKAVELRELIAREVELDRKRPREDRTIWRLSTPDHKHHWLPIVQALAQNDQDLLHED